MNKKKLLLTTALIILIIILQTQDINVAKIKQLLETAGIAGEVLFIIIYAIATIALLPGTIMTVTGGIIYGTIKGTILNLIGATTGATASFLIAKYLGADSIAKINQKQIKQLNKYVAKKGFENTLLLRIIPVIPFNILNYGLGLTKIKLSEYVLATIIGMIPATFIYTLASSRVGELVIDKGISSLGYEDLKKLILPIILFIILTITTLKIKHERDKRNNTLL